MKNQQESGDKKEEWRKWGKREAKTEEHDERLEAGETSQGEIVSDKMQEDF